MTTEQFTYWLQGFFEISEDKKLNERQVQIIRDHLALVFDKVTPDRSGPTLQDLEVKKNVVPSGLFKKENPNKGLFASNYKKHPFEDETRVTCSAAEIENEKDPVIKALKMGKTVYC